MTDYKFADGATVYFNNDYGIPADGQVVDRFRDDEGEAWYVVIDCTTPHGHEVELPEDKLRGVA